MFGSFGLRRAFVTIALTILLSAVSAQAQIGVEGQPLSFTQQLHAEAPSVLLAPIDVAVYMQEDARASKDEPFRFGATLDVLYTPANSGEWTELPDGDRLWRLRIVSQQAYSMCLLFDRYDLPEGATLHLYNDDRSQVIGAFTRANNWIDGTFTTQHVAGDAITVEYYEPSAVRGRGVLSIYKVVHAYRNIFGRAERLDDYGDSGTCNVNVNCPVGANWQDQKRGVALIIDGGSRICTGSLINNTANNFTPLFLTANHCLGGETHWTFVFNYESPTCTNQDGPTNQSITNATRLANNSASDFALLQLSSNVPLTYNPYFCGWSRIDTPSTNSICIHHPEGDIKKISFDDQPCVSDRYLGSSGVANSHWKIVDWDNGTTEPGSSGSPLFDQNHRIIGQLHGGYAACNNNSADWYGKLAMSWDYGTTAATRLRDWLDPQNTGAQTLFGLDPNGGGFLMGSVTTNGTTPLADVLVTVLEVDRETTTDASGEYALPVTPGTFTLIFTKYGYQRIVVNDVTIADGDTVTVDAVMPQAETGVLAGTVTSQHGVPVEGAGVLIRGTPLDTLTTDSEGRFIAELPATSYSAQAWIIVNIFPLDTVETVADVVVTNADTSYATIVLTLPRTEPTDTDAYGYRAYDRYDSLYPAAYEWIEIDPMLGGEGDEFFFPGHDSSVSLPLPITLKFYGQEFDTLTVNENGWLAPGNQHSAENVNSSIPNYSADEPAGTIAPFWDDFRLGLGNQQFYRYDSDHGRVIIQYNMQRLLTPPNRNHDFQVHFLDPVYHPTLNGDWEILFVYGRTDYANFCTIGIENPAQTSGVQVQYNTAWNVHSWPIERGAAQRFTTGRGTGLGTVNVDFNLYPPSADILNTVVYVAGRTVVADQGLFMQDSIPAVSACGIMMLEGYERTRQCGMPITANTVNNVVFEAWRLDPARSLSATQYEGAVTLSWRVPESVHYQANPDVRYSVFRDAYLIASQISDTFFTDEPLPDDQVVHYFVMTQYPFGNSAPSEILDVEIDLATGDAQEAIPATFALHPAFPNPFNPATTIRFDLPREAAISLRVFNIAGQTVAELVSGVHPAGHHAVTWSAEDFPSGTYLAVFETPGHKFVQKMLLLK